MNTNLVQLVGLDANQGLYRVPNGLNAQECFNECFDKVFEDNEDAELSEVDDLLEEEYQIKRAWIEEVFTEKL